MKTNKIDSHQVRSLVGILSIFLVSFIALLGANKLINQKEISNNIASIINNNLKVLSEEQEVEDFLNNNETILSFYAMSFKIDIDKFRDSLVRDYKEIDLLNTDNLDLALIDYLLKLESTDKNLFNSKISSCKDNEAYIIALINYFTNKIGTVDFKTAAAIAKVESGFSAKGMLKVNNIYGGLVNNRLLKYKTIEYGVIKYIKLLKNGYYDMGLTTVESIGRKYNPVNIDGKKVASPTWVSNTKKYIKGFNDYTDITDINELYSLKTSLV